MPNTRPSSEFNPSVYGIGNATTRPSTIGGSEAVEMSMLRSRSGLTLNSHLQQQQHQFPSDDQITTEIRDILRTADLMTVTKKSIRLQLENKFGLKLGSKRDYINYVTEAILTGEL
jgi:chitin synthase